MYSDWEYGVIDCPKCSDGDMLFRIESNNDKLLIIFKCSCCNYTYTEKYL